MLTTFFKSRITKIIGVDIGSSSAKAVLLSKFNNTYKVEHVANVDIPKGMIVDNDIVDVEVVGSIVKHLKKQFSTFNVDYAAAAVSGSGVIAKTVHINTVTSDEELAFQMEIEAESSIPYPIDEVCIDFEVIQDNEEDKEKIDVLLVASRRELVEKRTQALEVGGFKAKIIDIEGYALGRSIELVLHQLSADEQKHPITLVDIGASMLTITIVVEGDTVFVKEHDFGGEQYTQSIASHYGISRDEAELAKVNNNLPPDHVTEVLFPFKTILIQLLKRTLQIFSNDSGGDKVIKIMLSGGSSQIPKLVSSIEGELNIPCIQVKPFNDCKIEKLIDINELKSTGMNYMMACGLALRGFK